jgi:two-component system, OmpR family, sensor histidine kinase BaeS
MKGPVINFRLMMLLSYVPLALLPMLLIGIAVQRATAQSLSLLVQRDSRERLAALAPCLAALYQQDATMEALNGLFTPGQTPATNMLELGIAIAKPNGSGHYYLSSVGGWVCFPLDAGGVFQNPAPGGRGGDRPGRPGGPPMRPENGGPPFFAPDFNRPTNMLLITDLEGVVLASSSGQGIGQTLSREVLSQGLPLLIEGQSRAVALLGTGLGALNDAQQQVLDSVNTALIVAAFLAVLGAVLIGWWLSGQIARPVHALTRGAQQLADGTWAGEIPVRTRHEIGALTQAFNQMASRILRQQQMNRQMVADIAHDLRTPISTMSLEIEALEAGLQTPAKVAISLREELDWLKRMVDDLRTLSLMDAEKITLQRQTVALTPFLQAIDDLWQPVAEATARKMVLEIPPHLPTVMIDQGRMRQVLGNLLDNAIRHTRPDDTITLRATAAQGHVMVQVADTGEGIPEEAMPHIFDRFYRADKARGHERGGSGLGLSIAKRFVEMHQGVITVHSQSGKGTVFSIRLPVSA